MKNHKIMCLQVAQSIDCATWCLLILNSWPCSNKTVCAVESGLYQFEHLLTPLAPVQNGTVQLTQAQWCFF